MKAVPLTFPCCIQYGWCGTTPDHCRGIPSPTPVPPTKQGDWTACTNSNQCTNQCCSGKYSSNILKCTPVGGFKPWEGCTGSATRNLRGGDTAEDGFHSAADDESTFQQHSAVEELVSDSLEYEAAAEDTHGAVLN